MLLELSEDLKKYFKDEQRIFEKLMQLSGECYRDVQSRQTLRFVKNNRAYFIKKHFGLGWKETIKSLLSFSMPVFSAKNEWNAIQYLQSIGIKTAKIVGIAKRGFNPARCQSFIISEELTNFINLHDLTRDWEKTPPLFIFKRSLIEVLATIMRRMHENGFNHRDCYILHFYINKTLLNTELKIDDLPLHVIDLHRSQIRRRTPLRWVIKDLVGLYFSSKESYLTKRDLLRFIKCYRNQSLRTIMRKERHFWENVVRKGEALYATKPIV